MDAAAGDVEEIRHRAVEHPVDDVAQRAADEKTGENLRAGAEGAKAILVAGRPLNEPIAQHGPFVMNTREQIFQAVEDFRRGALA